MEAWGCLLSMFNEIDVIYNRFGEPVLRLSDTGRLVGFDGKSVGFLDGINLYNYSGHHVGWYEGGIMRDHDSATIGFGENPTDSPKPFLPFKQFKPFPSFVEFEVHRPFKQYAPFRPFKKYGWSSIDDPRLLFFK